MVHLVPDDSNNQGVAGLIGQRAGMQQHTVQLSQLLFAAFQLHLLSSAYPQELGVSILNDLHRQRQTITNARDTLHGADDNIATARRVLATMSRRLMTNKLIMGGVS